MPHAKTLQRPTLPRGSGRPWTNPHHAALASFGIAHRWQPFKVESEHDAHAWILAQVKPRFK